MLVWNWTLIPATEAAITDDVPFDVGFIGYNYLGNYIPAAGGYDKADTKEAYGSVGYKWVTVKYSYAFWTAS